MAKSKAATTAAPAPAKKQPAKSPKPKSSQQLKPKNQPAADKPLPPPVPVDSVDAYNLGAIFQQPSQTNPNPAGSVPPSATSSVSEPKPGEPLSQEQEQLLSDLDGGADPHGAPGAVPPAEETQLVSINFDETYVRDVLEEAFAWLGEKFESDHWLLTERQSRMLGGPATQLLGSLSMHLQRLLPSILERWASSTPGLMDCVFAFGLVLTPKVTKQFAISRERRQGKRPAARGAAAQPAARPAAPRPSSSMAVGPIDTGGPIMEVA